MNSERLESVDTSLGLIRRLVNAQADPWVVINKGGAQMAVYIGAHFHACLQNNWYLNAEP